MSLHLELALLLELEQGPLVLAAHPLVAGHLLVHLLLHVLLLLLGHDARRADGGEVVSSVLGEGGRGGVVRPRSVTWGYRLGLASARRETVRRAALTACRNTNLQKKILFILILK